MPILSLNVMIEITPFVWKKNSQSLTQLKSRLDNETLLAKI